MTAADRGAIEEQVRRICLSFPGVEERLSHGAPGFFVKRQFVSLWTHGHHDDDFPHLWCAAADGAQAHLISRDPNRFFRPPYVGQRGWIGVRLDGDLDWGDVEDACEQAYRVIAPGRLVAQLDET